MRLTRRSMLGAMLAGCATGAMAKAPTESPRPLARGAKAALPSAQEMVEGIRLSGKVSFVVADARTGEILEAVNPLLPQPPASTAKALTTLYALDRLGSDHRFTTHLMATGPIENGRLEGDLILAGGGDPILDTADLAKMAIKLKELGVREVAGHLKVWTGALPNMFEVDAEQPDHVGYNPSVGGLNLNFNRVHFEWKRMGDGYLTTMEAPAAALQPGVEMAQIEVVERRSPIFAYSKGEDRDNWTVADWALGTDGGRWLPTRFPGIYAGEVFQVLARANGIVIGGEVQRTENPDGRAIVSHESDPLDPILKGMLKHSTNLTAEIVGMSATSAAGTPARDLPASASAMNTWFRETADMSSIEFRDHSGLNDDSRISAADMVRALVWDGPDGNLKPLLKPVNLSTAPDLRIAAKTGTLNFVSALTGFIEGPGKKPLAFAILTADLAQRDRLSMEQRENPPGGRPWLARSRSLQRALLARWGTDFTS